jgi:DNA anti-recombination protein RmuC
MSVLKRRCRMVSFRLSDEEYEGLKSICMTVGARSLSDVARDAVQRMLGNGVASKKDLEAEVDSLTAKMDSLAKEVQRITKLLEGDKAEGTAAGS